MEQTETHLEKTDYHSHFHFVAVHVLELVFCLNLDNLRCAK